MPPPPSPLCCILAAFSRPCSNHEESRLGVEQKEREGESEAGAAATVSCNSPFCRLRRRPAFRPYVSESSPSLKLLISGAVDRSAWRRTDMLRLGLGVTLYLTDVATTQKKNAGNRGWRKGTVEEFRLGDNWDVSPTRLHSTGTDLQTVGTKPGDSLRFPRLVSIERVRSFSSIKSMNGCHGNRLAGDREQGRCC